MDKAGKHYWNTSWAGSALPAAIDPADFRLSNYVNRRFHQFFTSVFSDMETKSLSLLEIGCAKSAWLPYFAKMYGFVITGLDYSPVGCQMARSVLNANKVTGDIICADFFSPPLDMLGRFDVIVSFGVVEHFDDTAACLTAISKFLKPGGVLITSIPNMTGLVGTLQRVINQPVFDIHKPIDSVALRDAHKVARLEVTKCDYFIFTNFGVANLEGVSTSTIKGFFKRLVLAAMVRLSMLVWWLESKCYLIKPIKHTSPYIVCVAFKSLT
jgi:2-polyprenyl-3-methyl-5-hydroxy-6-metoxy-1,4-benzoquinol methylase